MAEWATPDKKKDKGFETYPVRMPVFEPTTTPVVQPQTEPARVR